MLKSNNNRNKILFKGDTSMNEKYKHLFSPLTIRNITLKNRIEASPVSLFDLATTPEHALSHDDIGFYRLRASGGAAIVTIGDGIVHPSGVDSGYLASPKVMPCYDDSIPFFRRVTDEIHRYNCVACLQLNHAGMLSTSSELSGWGPDFIDFDAEKENFEAPLSNQASGEQSAGRSGVVQYMTEEMIEIIVDAFGTSALRAKNCGFDMAMIHGGHGWLIHQFLSPLTNHRSDSFGGNLLNRSRLLVMVIDRIRKYCGEDFLIELRLSGTEYVDGGYTVEDAAEICKMIEDKIDIFHVSAGNFVYPDTECLMIPTIFTENGHNVYLAEAIKKKVKTVVSTIGAISDPAMMEEIISSGKADMVALGRALIADPELPCKILRKQEEEVRPCIRCTFCLADYQMRSLRCSVNPTAHRPWEALLPQKQTSPKTVLIAGGGPAGMEAAITAKERGHKVILCEKSARLGGLIRYSRAVSFKKETEKYMDYLINKTNRMDIDIRLNTEVTPDLIKNIDPDFCIAAIGAKAIVPKISGIDRAHMIMDIYDNKIEAEGKIVIIGGGIAGSEAAVEFAMKGKEVILLEMTDDIAKDANPVHRKALLMEIGKYGHLISVMKKTRCTEINEDNVQCKNENDETVTIDAKFVVLAAGLLPLREQVDELRKVSNEFDWVGDCKKPRQIRHAVLEGYNAAMNI